MGIAQQYKHVSQEVAEVCKNAGRSPQEVTLIAVSKTVGPEGVHDAISAGATQFGENRPNQIMEKAYLFPQVTWHFIGNIQSRRIPDIVESATLIHSLYQLHHAQKINEAAYEHSKKQKVLVEVNVSGEESKSGLAPAEVLPFIQECVKLPNLAVCGLMTMAPAGSTTVAREVFAGLRELFEEIKSQLPPEHASLFTELSMGMSDDWPEAIAEGATLIRVGRAIFSDSYEEKAFTC